MKNVTVGTGNFIDTFKVNWEFPVLVRVEINHEDDTLKGVFEIDSDDVWYGFSTQDNITAISMNVFDTSMDSGNTLEFNLFLCTEKDDNGVWNMDRSIEITNQCDIKIEVIQGEVLSVFERLNDKRPRTISDLREIENTAVAVINFIQDETDFWKNRKKSVMDNVTWVHNNLILYIVKCNLNIYNDIHKIEKEALRLMRDYYKVCVIRTKK